jgi:hypothetical protein
MSLHGIAAAMYQKHNGQHVVSASVLNSTSNEHIVITDSEVIDIDPNSANTNGRRALMVLLEQVCSFRAQIEEIGESAILVPLPVVHGVAQQHDHVAYARMIRMAFPEYFLGNTAPAQGSSVNTLLRFLLRKHHSASCMPTALSDEPVAQIALHDFQLFLPGEVQSNVGLNVSQDDVQLGNRIASLLNLAKANNLQAIALLQNLARIDANNYADSLVEKRILDSARFIQFGLHTDQFKNSLRYTYLEHANLKDIFIQTFIARLSEAHNVCLKTPNDPSSPAFADITATFLADVWMLIHYHRTGTPKRFTNVIAKSL